MHPKNDHAHLLILAMLNSGQVRGEDLEEGDRQSEDMSRRELVQTGQWKEERSFLYGLSV